MANIPIPTSRLTEIVASMKHNTLSNYIVAGLSSSAVGNGGHENGKVRLFKADRATRDEITPHSHRFDFVCLVLQGAVVNSLYEPPYGSGDKAEEWCVSTIDQVCGADGIREYVHTREAEPVRMVRRDFTYTAGQTYGMYTPEIHSITFSQGAQVLFFEGPQKQARSVMLEPWVNGKVVPTFRTEPWMFEKEIQ